MPDAAPADMSVRDHCTTCGACCAAFRVDFDCSELASSMAGGVPDALALRLVGRLMRMRGSDDPQPRCVALNGEVGVEVACSIYSARPSPCREFAPYAALGIGDDACARARRRHGLPPLGETRAG